MEMENPPGPLLLLLLPSPSICSLCSHRKASSHSPVPGPLQILLLCLERSSPAHHPGLDHTSPPPQRGLP